MSYPSPDTNVKDLHSRMFSDICEEIRPKWREFEKSLEERTFKLKPLQIEEIAKAVHQEGTWNCAEKFMLKLSSRNFQVKHLIKYCRKLHLCDALEYLVPPEPIQIIEHSELSLTVKEGDDIRLYCQASSVPPPRYTWYCRREEGDTAISHCTKDPTLILPDAKPDQSARYVCGVTRKEEEQGEVKWSEWIQVTVQAAPSREREALMHSLSKLSMDPPQLAAATAASPLRAPFIVNQTGTRNGQEVSRPYGSELILECLGRGNPSPEYKWLKDNQELKESAEVSGVNSPTLQIPKVYGYHSGSYECRISNCQGEARSYVLQVKVMDGKIDKLEIVTHPSDSTVQQGAEARLSVKAKGQNLRYQWYRNGKPIQGATESIYTIIGANLDHRGKYQCKVSIHDDSGNMLKDTLSNEGQLKVRVDSAKGQYVESKVALVIGVSPERGNESKLMCVINDCILITRKLKDLGFKVMSFYDLTKNEIDTAVQLFKKCVDTNVYAVVYMAGHGFYAAGQHFFVPVDPREGASLDHCYCIEALQKTLLQKRPKLLAMFIDICRTAYLGAGGAPEVEQSANEEKGNLIVFYATLPYNQAFEPNIPMFNTMRELQMPLEMPGEHGVFCKLLNKVLHRDCLVDELFKDIQTEFLQSVDYERMKRENCFMIPTLQNHLLDTHMSLTDPVCTDVTPNKEKWERIWKSISSLRDVTTYKFSDGIQITIECEELLSTVVRVKVVPRYTNPSFNNQNRIDVKLDLNTLPKVLCVSQREDAIVSGKLYGATAIISRLHKQTKHEWKVHIVTQRNGREYEYGSVQVLMNYVLISSHAANFRHAELESQAYGASSGAALAEPHGEEHVDYEARGGAK